MAFSGLSSKGALKGWRGADIHRSNLATAEQGRDTQKAELQIKKNDEANKLIESSSSALVERITSLKEIDAPQESINKEIAASSQALIQRMRGLNESGFQLSMTEEALKNNIQSAMSKRGTTEQLKQDAIKQKAIAMAKKQGEEAGSTPDHTAVRVGKPGEQLTVRIDPETNMWTDLNGDPINEKLYNVVGMARASGKSSGETADAITTSTQTELEKKLIATNDSIANLESIADSYEKEFLQLPAKAELWALSTKESLGFDLTPKQEKTVDKISVFKRRSIAAVNSVIKEITGAQMSELEAKRIRKQVPDPEKDSPSEYRAKLRDVLKHTKLARARYKHMLRNGMQHDFAGDSEPSLSLDRMEQIIDQRVMEMRDMDMEPSEIRAKIKEEFDI